MNNYLWSLKTRLYRIFRTRFPFNIILKSEYKNIELLLKSISIDGIEIIDLGCGMGNIVQFFDRAERVICIDLTLSMLQSARIEHPDVNLIQSDAICLPVPNEHFNLVTAIGLSEYIKNIDLLFTETSRILKNNGHFLMTFSPAGLFSALRLLLGHRIYPLSQDHVKFMAKKFQFDLVKIERTFMQCQVLFRKIT